MLPCSLFATSCFNDHRVVYAWHGVRNSRIKVKFNDQFSVYVVFIALKGKTSSFLIPAFRQTCRNTAMHFTGSLGNPAIARFVAFPRVPELSRATMNTIIHVFDKIRKVDLSQKLLCRETCDLPKLYEICEVSVLLVRLL